MKKINKFVLVLMVIMISVSLIACSSGTKTPDKPAGEQKPAATKIKATIGTGGSGGVFYVLGAGMADIINQKSSKINLTAQSTAATTETLNLISTGQIDLGFSLYDTAYFATIGQREYTKKLDNITLVMFGHVGLYTPVTFADTPYKTFEDLKAVSNKIPISPGALGKVLGTEAMKPWGINLSDKPSALSFTEMADGLKNGTIPVATYHGAHPASSVMDMAATKPIRIISQTEESMKKILEANPYWVRAVIPGGMYKGQDTDAITFGTPYCIVAKKDAPAEVVTEFLDILLANNPDLIKIHAEGKWYTKDHASYQNAPMFPYHPAAEKYLKEKGIIK